MNKYLHSKKARVLFEDTNEKDKVVGSHQFPDQSFGNKVNYHKIASDYIPDGYQFASYDQLNDSVIKPNNKYIVYVKSASKKRNGEIVIRYDLHGDRGHIIKQETEDCPVGHRFNAEKYIKKVPAGYRVNKVVNSTPIIQFTDHRQYLDLGVLPISDSNNKTAHKEVKKSSQVTDGILYQNADNGNVEGTAVISGPRGMAINYSPYTRNGSKYMPKGYHFDHLATNAGHILKPNTSYTIFIKAGEPKQPSKLSPKSSKAVAKPSSGHKESDTSHKKKSVKSHQANEIHDIMVYYDTKTNRPVKSVPIKGLQGHPVDYSNYMMASELPSHYHLVGLGVHASNFFKPGARYIILVEADHVASQPQFVNETVNYRNARTNHLIDSQHINGPVGLSFNYKQYIPKGYYFVRLSPDSKAQLKSNAHCDVLILPKVSQSDVNHSSQSSNTENHAKSKAARIKFNHFASKRSASLSNHDAASRNSEVISPQHHTFNSQKPNPRIPQVGGTNKAANIGIILENLGKSLSALGHAISHHQI